MFSFRKLLAALVTPSLLVAAALVTGAVMLFFGRTRRAGRWVVVGGVALLLLISVGVPFDPVGAWLEGRHAALVDPAGVDGLEEVRWVVVLGGGHRAAAVLPVTSYLNESSVFRVIEGVRIHGALPESRLLFTGWGGGDDVPSSAAVGAALAEAMGVDRERIVLEEAPRTTGEEAAAVAARVGEGPVVLVTSAVHMPRAVRLMERAGVQVIPAPTGHVVFGQRKSLRDWLVPSPGRLGYADRVVHELGGLVVMRGL